MKRTGGQIVWEALKREGVDVIFGYPGGAILPTYDAMVDYDIHHVLVRHEQGASHMADGYARATGKVGCCIATSGPGATNLITGLATAMLDSSPVVAITGQVGSKAIGTDAFQETDVTGVSMPVTKHNYLVTDVRELPRVMREAFYIARSGRPGPVLVDIAKDAQQASLEFEWDERPIRLRGHRPQPRAVSESIAKALDMIRSAKRPVILAGHGIVLSGAYREVREFAEKTNTPVALTLLGIGAFPRSHPLCLGPMGMHGEAYVNRAIQESDLLLAFGMRFDDRVTGNLKMYAPHARKIHIEIDPTEVNKNVKVDVAIISDLKDALEQINPLVEAGDHSEWIAAIQDWMQDTHARDIIRQDPGGKLLSPHVMLDLWKATEGNAITVSDVGQHQMYEMQYYGHERPKTLITSGGLGTMGFALPAAIGTKMGRPNEEVWVVAGDGGFQMTMAELATCVQENIELKIAVVNNNFLGMVRQWQEFFYDKRYAATPLFNPDFTKIAGAYGIPSYKVTQRADVIPTIQQARNTPGTVLIEFVVEAEEVVYPMVPAGASLSDMIRRPVNGTQTQVTDDMKQAGIGAGSV
ncbi:MAG: biosynthetic-type acetolactate synthase large subunit [Anaerolineae bacterium]|nr:biosynthetic-type acetolactate synthase large subunit [Anaerolineae bacterium]